jgi:membrane protein DedA with SNARE-associated domain
VQSVSSVLGFLADLPPALIYGVLGAGAALENLVPPVPADTFVLLGGFLAGRGRVDAWIAWLVTWGFNVGTALLVYGIAFRHGRTFFEVGLGRHVLNEHQLHRMARFYQRFGPFAIFFTRFLPGLRAVVPAFAGVTHQRFLPVALPVAAASGIWYGALVWLGSAAGQNLDTLIRWVENANLLLLVVAGVIGAGLVTWWLRTRRHSRGEGTPQP